MTADQALFTIRPADYEHAARVLKTVGCYLSPTGNGSQAVCCSASLSPTAYEMRAERAREALEKNRVLVWES